MRRSFTQQILEKIDVRTFYSRFTELAEVSGKRECKGLCPLHEEKTPSFFVNLETGSFHCFGCGRGGGLVQFYQAYYDLNFRDAIRRLAEELGLGTGAGAPNQRPGGSAGSRRQRNPARETHSTDDLSASGNSFGYHEIYSALLQAGQPLPDEVIAYFATRKI